MSKGNRKTRRLRLSNNFSSRNRDLVSLATDFIGLPKLKDSLVRILHCPPHCCCLGLPPRQGLGTTTALGGDSGQDAVLLCAAPPALSLWPCWQRATQRLPRKKWQIVTSTVFYCSALRKRASQFFIFKLGGLASVYPSLMKELKSTGLSFFFKSFV